MNEEKEEKGAGGEFLMKIFTMSGFDGLYGSIGCIGRGHVFCVFDFAVCTGMVVAISTIRGDLKLTGIPATAMSISQ